ncbi:hypothetical protein, partial [Staphylococcus epidermidis]|uniref:hypothetical protein n=1 Tax=Staphylococcus epidermidis TaxID=1282 RepID=UPI0021B4919A
MGTGKAPQNAILFKPPQHIQPTHPINTLLLHKTPTITNPTPQLTHFTPDHQTLQFLPTPKKRAQHPLPQPILT